MFFRGNSESKHTNLSSNFTTTTSEVIPMSDDEDQNQIAMEVDTISEDPGVFIAPVVNIMFDYYGLTRLDAKVNPKVSVNTIFNAVAEHRHRLLPILLQHVVRGEQAEAEVMLENNPGLLFETGRATDYSGRPIEGTALQMALGADDADMCEMIISYLDQLDPEEKHRQYQRQFPQDEKYKQSVEDEDNRDIDALDAVVKAITESKKDKDCEADIIQFRHYLEEKSKNVITTGRHLYMKFPLLLYENYLVFYDYFDERKRNLYWRLMGYMQRFLPACFVQAFINSHYKNDSDASPLPRDLKLDGTEGFYYPLTGNSRLGFDYAILNNRKKAGHSCDVVFKRHLELVVKYVAFQQKRCANLFKPDLPSRAPQQATSVAASRFCPIL